MSRFLSNDFINKDPRAKLTVAKMANIGDLVTPSAEYLTASGLTSLTVTAGCVVNMRVDFDSIKNTSTVATGWVEIEGIFKFPVSVRKWFDDKSGKEMMFVSYPQRKDGDRYSGVVYPHDREVRNEIDRVVLDVTKEKLFAESVPDVNIDDVRITPLNQKTGSVVQKLGIASVKMYGMTVNGIVIKEGRKGRFVQMPQYQTQGQYRDTVYGVTAAIQRKIEERVLLEYDKIIRAQEEVNMQEVQETKNNQEIEQTDEYRRQVSAIYDYENRNNIPENDRMTKWYDEMNAAVAKPWYKENDTGRVPISESTIAARYAEISGEQQTAGNTQAIQEEQKKDEENEKRLSMRLLHLLLLKAASSTAWALTLTIFPLLRKQ